MAELRFTFGTMGSGKSTQALQIHHNLRARGLNTVLMTQLDRQGGRVSSRLGVSAEAELINPSTDLFELIAGRVDADGEVHAVVCDEVQFYDPHQCEQLARVVDDLGVDVYAFGLLTSFQGELFPGTARMLELADIRTEIQVEARCWCGSRATHNARLVNGKQLVSGQLKVVGDTAAGQADQITYDLRCRRHWLEGAREARGEQLALLETQRLPAAPGHSGPVVVDADPTQTQSDPYEATGTNS